MSQPQVHVKNGNSNISFGSDASKMKNSNNLVIGNGKAESRSTDAPPKIEPRMAATDNAIIIGNGAIRGRRAKALGAAAAYATKAATVVPNGAIMIGNNVSIPVEDNTDGTPAANIEDHLIFGDALVPAAVSAATDSTHSIPIWYNNRRYKLLVSDL